MTSDATRAHARISVMDAMIARLRRELKAATELPREAVAKTQHAPAAEMSARTSGSGAAASRSSRSTDNSADERGSDVGSARQASMPGDTSTVMKPATLPTADMHTVSEVPPVVTAADCDPTSTGGAMGLFAALQRRWLQQLDDRNTNDADATGEHTHATTLPLADSVLETLLPTASSSERASAPQVTSQSSAEDAAQLPMQPSRRPALTTTGIAEAPLLPVGHEPASVALPLQAPAAASAAMLQDEAKQTRPSAAAVQEPASTHAVAAERAQAMLFAMRPHGALQAGWLVQTPAGLAFMPVAALPPVATQQSPAAVHCMLSVAMEARRTQAGPTGPLATRDQRARSAQQRRALDAAAGPPKRPCSAPHACADATLMSGIIGFASPSALNSGAQGSGAAAGLRTAPRQHLPGRLAALHVPTSGFGIGRRSADTLTLMRAAATRSLSPPAAAAELRQVGSDARRMLSGLQAASSPAQRSHTRGTHPARLSLAVALPAVIDHLRLLPLASADAQDEAAEAQARKLTASLVALHDCSAPSNTGVLNAHADGPAIRSLTVGAGAAAPPLPSPLVAGAITMRRAAAAGSEAIIVDHPEAHHRAQTSSCVQRPAPMHSSPPPRPLSAGTLAGAQPASHHCMSTARIWPLGFQQPPAAVEVGTAATTDTPAH